MTTAAPKRRLSQNEVVLATLEEHRGQWVPMWLLGQLADSMNVHSRIDEIRHRTGVTIENRIEQHGPRKRSFYRIP